MATDDESRVTLRNPHLTKANEDCLYHLALSTASHDLRDMFSDVKFVCMGGTPRRMEAFARYIQMELDIKLPAGADLFDISRYSYRYSMFKIGPVISVSHGMGTPSLSILMHEIIKLVHHAECRNVTFLRIGTCGGIGLPGGTVIISKSTVDHLLRPFFETHILGKCVERPAILDQSLAEELKTIGQLNFPQYKIVLGKTMCTHDFYEGQARLDGAFCDYSQEEKFKYLTSLKKDAGVTNIEMVSLAFAAFCHHAGVKGAVVCVALLNRLDGDQINTPKETLEEWQHRPQQLIAKFIQKRLREHS